MKKKILGIFVLLITCFGMFITNAQAKEKVTIYLFSQTTCPHCREAKAFFKELKKDSKYKDMFELRDLSVNDENHKEYQDLFEKAAEKMGDEADGVPYYVIGNKSFTKGYSSKLNDEIKKTIEETYEQEIVCPIADIVGDKGEILYENVGNDVLAPIIVLVIALAIIGGTIYFARQSGEEEKDKKKSAEKEEKKETVVKEEEQKLPKEEEVKEQDFNLDEPEIIKEEKKSTQAKKASSKSTSSKNTKKTTIAKKTATKKAPTKKSTTTKATTKKRNTTNKK